MRTRSLTLAVSALLLATAPAAQAAEPDAWVRWNGPDVHVRTLAFPSASEVLAGTEGSGVFGNTLFGATNWSDVSTGLAGAAKNIRAIHGTGNATLIGTTQGLFKRAGQSWSPLAQGDGAGTLNAAVQAIYSRPGTSELYAGVLSGGVYKSTDGGAHWAASSQGMQAATTVFALAGHPAVPHRIFAGTSHGIYRSIDYGASWTFASDGLPAGNVFDIEVDPGNPALMYAATSSNGVFASSDGGITWRQANGSAPNALKPVTVRDLEPYLPVADKPNFSMAAATDQGVWATADRGQTWGPMSKAAVGQSFDPLTWSLAMRQGTLFAGTQTKGVYRLPIFQMVNTAAPAVLGTKKEGQLVEALHGTWTGTAPQTFAYAWKRCTSADPATCKTIDGEQGDAYRLTSDDIGHYIRVAVTGTNLVPGESPTAVSAPAGPVQVSDATANASTPKPVINDGPVVEPKFASPAVGETVTGTRGNWNPAGTYTYQWQRCADAGCEDIAGAQGGFGYGSKTSYTLTAADFGKRVRLLVIATNGVYAGGAVSNTSALVIEPYPKAISSPVIGSATAIGATVISTVGVWSDATWWERTWLLCDDPSCTAYAPAGTGTAFTIPAHAQGKYLRLRVTAHNTHATRKTEAFSDIVGPLAPAPSPAPAPVPQGPGGGGTVGAGGGGQVVGATPMAAPAVTRPFQVSPVKGKRVRVGTTLKVHGAGVRFTRMTFRWLRNGKAIAKATARLYRVRRADRGRRIACRVVLAGPGGTTTVVTKAIKIRR